MRLQLRATDKIIEIQICFGMLHKRSYNGAISELVMKFATIIRMIPTYHFSSMSVNMTHVHCILHAVACFERTTFFDIMLWKLFRFVSKWT